MTSEDLTGRCINTIRFLAVDAVQAARSGHPGAPLGAAAMAHVLWDRFLVCTTRRTRIGRIETVLCSPPAMHQHCSTHCSISTAMTYHWKT